MAVYKHLLMRLAVSTHFRISSHFLQPTQSHHLISTRRLGIDHFSVASISTNVSTLLDLLICCKFWPMSYEVDMCHLLSPLSHQPLSVHLT